MNWMLTCTLCAFLCLTKLHTGLGIGSFTYNNWKFHFPSGSSMGVFLAVALPFEELKDESAYFAYNFEANYALPSNETQLTYPPIIERKMVYEVLESKLQNLGYAGKGCLLRTICEASAVPFHEVAGVLGNLLHILLTPSSSKKENITSDYEIAENVGRTTRDCANYHNNCSVSLIDLFSFIGTAM